LRRLESPLARAPWRLAERLFQISPSESGTSKPSSLPSLSRPPVRPFKDGKRDDDLLDTFYYGIAIALGNTEGF
jgi:hypothetical protein